MSDIHVGEQRYRRVLVTNLATSILMLVANSENLGHWLPYQGQFCAPGGILLNIILKVSCLILVSTGVCFSVARLSAPPPPCFLIFWEILTCQLELLSTENVSM